MQTARRNGGNTTGCASAPNRMPKPVGHHMRPYTLTELTRMLTVAGLTFERAHGDFDAAPYGVASGRMLVIGRKGEESAE